MLCRANITSGQRAAVDQKGWSTNATAQHRASSRPSPFASRLRAPVAHHLRVALDVQPGYQPGAASPRLRVDGGRRPPRATPARGSRPGVIYSLRHCVRAPHPRRLNRTLRAPSSAPAASFPHQFIRPLPSGLVGSGGAAPLLRPAPRWVHVPPPPGHKRPVESPGGSPARGGSIERGRLSRVAATLRVLWLGYWRPLLRAVLHRTFPSLARRRAWRPCPLTSTGSLLPTGYRP